MNNILKHSRAKQARIELERDVREVQLHITDDGCGFMTGKTGNRRKGMGLKNIAERVRILNGNLETDSEPGHGARLTVTIPIGGKRLRRRISVSLCRRIQHTLCTLCVRQDQSVDCGRSPAVSQRPASGDRERFIL
ncbi:MAG: ATP-binding protein [Limisphaerales bacterium]